MTLTPLKNTLSKKNHTKSTILYSACCCCCCLLAPIGSYITEKIMAKKYPYRKGFWGHVIINFGIGILGVIAIPILLDFFSRGSSSFIIQIIPLIVAPTLVFFLMYLLFYLNSYWFIKNHDKTQRLKAIFLQTLLTCVLGGVFFVASMYLGFIVLQL